MSEIQWILLGLLAIVTVSLVLWSMRRSNQGLALTPHEKLERMIQTRAIQSDLKQTMLELEQLAQRLGDDLDRRSRELRQVIAEADQRLAELDRRTKAAASLPTPAPVRRTIPEVEDEAPDELSVRVYQMADQGRPPIEIARNLNEQVGKVELILALRRR